MNDDLTIRAILQIWDDLTASPDWPILMHRLIPLIDHWHQTQDIGAHAEIRMQISDLLKSTNQELYQRFIATRKALREQTDPTFLGARGVSTPAEQGAIWNALRSQTLANAGNTIVGDITNGTGVAIGEGAQAKVEQHIEHHYHESRYTRYADISCPRRVGVDQRFTITVALTIQPQADSVVPQPINDLIASKIKVRLSSPGMEILTATEQVLVIDPDDDTTPVVFHLKAQHSGRYDVKIEFIQRSQCIAIARVPIEVLTTTPMFEAAILPPTTINPWMATGTAPDLTLVVKHDPSGIMTFTLSSNEIELFATDYRPPCDPQTWLNQIYDEIGLLQRGHESAGNHGPRLLNTTQIERRLKNLGHQLWDILIPPDLKAFYGRERTKWHVSTKEDRRWSLLVQSDDAQIPWELVRPYGTGTARWGEDFWCTTFYVARWLFKRPDVLECVAPPPQLILSAMARIVPTCFPELSAAPAEDAFLRDLIIQHHLIDRSPPRATEDALITLLEQGGYDWMHIITHGEFFAESARHRSTIGLEDQQWLACSAITGPDIRNTLGDQRPSFVINACHAQHAAPMLSGAASWATQLIGSGAGMLVAPLWSVRDDRAKQFSEVFYEALFNPERPATVAEALWHTRQSIYEPGDPTWLAYSLFAHPNATVRVATSGDKQAI